MDTIWLGAINFNDQKICIYYFLNILGSSSDCLLFYKSKRKREHKNQINHVLYTIIASDIRHRSLLGDCNLEWEYRMPCRLFNLIHKMFVLFILFFLNKISWGSICTMHTIEKFSIFCSIFLSVEIMTLKKGVDIDNKKYH